MSVMKSIFLEKVRSQIDQAVELHEQAIERGDSKIMISEYVTEIAILMAVYNSSLVKELGELQADESDVYYTCYKDIYEHIEEYPVIGKKPTATEMKVFTQAHPDFISHQKQVSRLEAEVEKLRKLNKLFEVKSNNLRAIGKELNQQMPY